ncbi:uncharacterized protein BDR25DRAFT_347922 [Lindgomyces ingoldianus]|uniref:Uncharacterized protein n=1 Tax=Lindgomyces ingoldianus TaxID=673940 RepID=A0ACB6RE14_9PLEO|nr:uncharacterized protein BDR25DRAFT_347922 [Lindgomyces ingoldianus]KAF2477589.1 hypothetical protein BDR25DRAFT_347922 [Lindgomyces ingoldianus]
MAGDRFPYPRTSMSLVVHDLRPYSRSPLKALPVVWALTGSIAFLFIIYHADLDATCAEYRRLEINLGLTLDYNTHCKTCSFDLRAHGPSISAPQCIALPSFIMFILHIRSGHVATLRLFPNSRILYPTAPKELYQLREGNQKGGFLALIITLLLRTSSTFMTACGLPIPRILERWFNFGTQGHRKPRIKTWDAFYKKINKYSCVSTQLNNFLFETHSTCFFLTSSTPITMFPLFRFTSPEATHIVLPCPVSGANTHSNLAQIRSLHMQQFPFATILKRHRSTLKCGFVATRHAAARGAPGVHHFGQISMCCSGQIAQCLPSNGLRHRFMLMYKYTVLTKFSFAYVGATSSPLRHHYSNG